MAAVVITPRVAVSLASTLGINYCRRGWRAARRLAHWSCAFGGCPHHVVSPRGARAFERRAAMAGGRGAGATRTAGTLLPLRLTISHTKASARSRRAVAVMGSGGAS